MGKNKSKIRSSSLLLATFMVSTLSFCWVSALLASTTPTHVTPNTVTTKDLKIIYNTLKFVHGLDKKKQTTIIVIYDPNNKASNDEATSIKTAAQFMMQPIQLHFLPVAMVSALGSPESPSSPSPSAPSSSAIAPPHNSVAYITQGISDHYSTIFEFSKAHHLFTISSDFNCVKTQCCILAFTISKGIDIHLNERNLRNLGYGVDAAFKFMVRRVM